MEAALELCVCEAGVLYEELQDVGETPPGEAPPGEGRPKELVGAMPARLEGVVEEVGM